MPDSIREKIIANVVTTLQSVTEPTYDITIQEVLRIPRGGFQVNALPAVIIIDAGETTQDGVPCNKHTRSLFLSLICYNYAFEGLSEASNKLMAAVEKALWVDRTRGGWAYDTDVIANEMILSEDAIPYGGAIIQVEIRYRHAIYDPYNL